MTNFWMFHLDIDIYNMDRLLLDRPLAIEKLYGLVVHTFLTRENYVIPAD